MMNSVIRFSFNGLWFQVQYKGMKGMEGMEGMKGIQRMKDGEWWMVDGMMEDWKNGMMEEWVI